MNRPLAGTHFPPLFAVPAEIHWRWAWHYRRLVAMRDHLRKRWRDRSRVAAEPLEKGGRDQADLATGDMGRDLAFAELAAEENSLAEVEAAIQRLHRGVYGYCEATGEPIPPERLRALPWGRYTVEAEAAREKSKR